MKRLRILTATTILALALAACGGADTGGTEPEDTAPGMAPTMAPGGDTGTDSGDLNGGDTGTDGGG